MKARAKYRGCFGAGIAYIIKMGVARNGIGLPISNRPEVTLASELMERWLTAILAADVAGYCRLMGRDEEGTVRDLKGHQAVVLPMIGELGGRIIDTAGDGILAEFASIVNAVECALAIQKTVHSGLGRARIHELISELP
jgi:class 3 adenylate cyclase